MGAVTPFIGEPLDFEIRDGVMHISKGEWSFATPLCTFRQNMVAAQDCLDVYDAKTFPREIGADILLIRH